MPSAKPLLLALLLAAMLPAEAARAGFEPKDSQALPAVACFQAVADLERDLAIPDQLLWAISLAESGRWDAARQAQFAWPWTVTSGKRGWRFADKAAAIAQVRVLQTDGVTNIDVGCMQINLRHHADAFATLEDAFDPAANAAYAARYLLELFDAKRSWTNAAGTYHSATREFFRPYRNKVIRLWNIERRRASIRRREAVKAAWEVKQMLRRQQAAKRAAKPAGAS